MKTILESIRENAINECSGSGCGLSASSSGYSYSSVSQYFDKSNGDYFIKIIS